MPYLPARNLYYAAQDMPRLLEVADRLPEVSDSQPENDSRLPMSLFCCPWRRSSCP